MKKILTLAVALTLALGVFTGCGAKASLTDGTYKAEYSTPDDHAWTDFVEVTVKDGKINAVDFDSLDAEGKKKSESEYYDNLMKDAGSETWPSKFFREYEAALIDKQDISKVDAVAGATMAGDTFKVLVAALEKNMKDGDTTTVSVSR